MACPSCSETVPDTARFCPSCGVAQQSTTPVDLADDEERRVVTVVFGDLVGFTSLSEHRDPERVKRLVDHVFAQLTRDVASFGGRVDKVLGDAIVALFGAPVAHEDDADRAVRASLTMLRTVRDFRDAHPDDPIRMRIGVNTGEVLVGTLAGTDYTAMGDVVNTAARLQEMARPGSVLVGRATRELCSPVIRFESFESVQLRGREQATDVWRAVSVDAATMTRRWSSDVPFVGRDAELRMLSAMTETVRSGRSVIVAVSGEAGIGKSRLVQETVAAFIANRSDTLLIEGACAPYGESNVWWPVASSLLARLSLDRNDTEEESRRRVVRRLSESADLVAGTPNFDRAVEVAMHLLGQPSGLDSLAPAGVRDAVVGGIVASLRRRAARAPVVLWVDDLQWAAPVLLELLETVARQLAGLPLLIITTNRPDESDATDWPPAVDPALTLHLTLETLDDEASTELVMRAAGRRLPDDVVRSISRRSGGNPLFLIELARLAASTDDLTPVELPGTLRALIAARLDQLTPSQRQVLDNAAILGNEGRVVALRQFAGELGQRFELDDLVDLEEAGLLLRNGSGWQFRSDVVREVAYRTLTKQARAQRHAGVARYLASFEPGLVDRRAHHAAAAAELSAELGSAVDVPPDIAREAVGLLADAARRWSDQGAHRRALELIDRGLALRVADDRVRRDLMLLRVESLVDLREGRPARARVAELAAFATATSDRALSGESARLLGTIEQNEGDLVAARVSLGEAVAIFRELGDPQRLAEALRARGFAEVFGGSLVDAEWFLGEAEALFADVGDRRGGGWVQQHRAWVSFLSGDHAESERRLRHAIAEFTELDDRAGTAWSRGLLGYVYHFTRRDDESLAVAGDVLADAKRWGDEWAESMMHNLLGSIRLWRGEVDEGRRHAERALAGFRRIDDRFGMIQALSVLSRSDVALGRLADANRSVEEVLSLADAFGKLAYPVTAAAGTAMHLGDGRRAAALAQQAVGRLDTTGANVDEGRVITAFGFLLDGDADATLGELLAVDVAGSPFGLAARATAFAVLGDHAAAMADVRALETMGAVSYWDRTVALVAGAVAATGDEAVRRRRDLAEWVDRFDDVVLTEYASRVLDGLAVTRPPSGDGPPPTSEPEPSGADSVDGAGPPIGGWGPLADRLVDRAPGGR